MYGGFRVTIQLQLKNIKDSFHLDIAIGDVILLAVNIFY